MYRLFTAKTKGEKITKLICIPLFALFVDIIAFCGASWAFSSKNIIKAAMAEEIGKALGTFFTGLLCLSLMIGVSVFAIIAVIKLVKATKIQTESATLSVEAVSAVTQEASENAENHSNRRVEESEPVVLSQTMESLANVLLNRNETYSNSVDLISLKNDFIRFCNTCGLVITEQIAIDTISAIASSRLILLSGNNDVRIKFANILGAFFGFKTFVNENTKSITSYESLLFNENKRTETAFAMGLYSAFKRKNALNFIALMDTELSEVDKYFKKFQSYIKAPSVSYAVNIDIYGRLNELDGLEKGFITMPQNTWFIMNKDGNDSLPYIYAKYATEVDLSGATIVSYSAQILENMPCVSVQAFLKEVDKVNESGGLSLDNWKKIDKIEAHLNALVGFSIDNRSFLQFERYLATMIALKYEENRAIDKLIAYRLTAIIACFNKTKIRNAEIRLDQFMLDTLGEGNLELSLNALNAFSLI